MGGFPNISLTLHDTGAEEWDGDWVASINFPDASFPLFSLEGVASDNHCVFASKGGGRSTRHREHIGQGADLEAGGWFRQRALPPAHDHRAGAWRRARKGKDAGTGEGEGEGAAAGATPRVATLMARQLLINDAFVGIFYIS